MAIFLVEALDALGKVDGVSSYLVEAADATRAKELCQSQNAGDAPWQSATVTTIATPFAADLAGWRYRIRVSKLPAGTEPDDIDVSYTAIASDTNDLIGAALVPLINATKIDGANYTAGTDTLVVAAGSDNMGDRTLRVETYPPGAKEPLPNSPLVSTIVHQGATGAVLSVIIPQPAPIPAVSRKFGLKVL